MNDFFQKEFYGNTVLQWAIALGIILASVLVAKLIYLLIGKFIKQITKRTKTRFDDILIDKFEEPAVFTIIIVGIWYGLSTLNLSPTAEDLLRKAWFFVLTFNVAWFIARLLDALIEEYLVPLTEKTESDLDDQLLPIARKGLRIAIWTLAIVVALNNAGYNIGAIIAGLGLGGLAFALAAQDSLSHFFGGVVLFTDKPFKINDRIITNEYEGFVKEIGMRSTRIRTLDGRMVTIPNADIANSTIVNVSSEYARKVISDIGLTYSTTAEEMKKATEILKEITAQNPDVDHERTIADFNSFGDFSLNIRFIYYINKKSEKDIYKVKNQINLAILQKFNENGLDFAFPTQTIYTIKG